MSVTSLKNKKIALIQGGPGPEKDISHKSAQAVKKILEKHTRFVFPIEADKNLCESLIRYKPDLAFLAVHGVFGEDGLVQSVCELLRLPYTGSGVLASALCMDKLFFKKFLRQNKIPTPEFQEIKEGKINLPFPLVVKSSHGGSSLGTYIVKTKTAFKEAVWKAEKLSGSVFAEQFIPKGSEIAVSFLGETVLTPLEIVPKGGFYDFKRKYTKGQSEYFLPARLDGEVIETLKVLSKKVIKLTGLRAYGRLDFIVDKENQPWLLEANTLPGLTATSLLPKSARYDGISFSHLIEIILSLAQTDYSL